MKPLVIIPARGGSKGLPGKNIKLLSGVPLIKYTIEAALGVFEKSVVCVSTDDVGIREVVEGLGLPVPFLRPAYLASDTSGTYEVITHAIEYYNKIGYDPDVIILLQPTSPFRTSRHVKEALDLFRQHDVEMVVSVKETKSNPYFVLFEENSEGFLSKSKTGNFSRRQDCPSVWEFNGAIYIINVEALRIRKNLSDFIKIKKYVMKSAESVDIDTELDWHVAEYLIDKNR